MPDMNISSFNWLLVVALGSVLIVLIFGIINLASTSEKAKSRSNKLMRLRVIAQFIAVVLLMIGFWFKTNKG
jgi:putative copper export protein